MLMVQCILAIPATCIFVKKPCLICNTSVHNGSLPHPSANSTLRCTSTESRADRTGPEEVESDACGIFAAANPTLSTGSYDATVLPNMVTVVLGLVCVLGTLRLFH